MVEAVAVGVAVASHTAVGQLPNVPCTYAARVYFKQVVKAPPIYLGLHDAVGSRRAAYIAETYEKYSFFHHLSVLDGKGNKNLFYLWSMMKKNGT